jgi:hypothetical protein
MSGHTLFKMGPFWHSFPGRELCQSPKRVPKQLHGRSGRKIRSLEQFGCGEAAKGQLPPLRPALYQDCPGWGPQEGGGLFFFLKNRWRSTVPSAAWAGGPTTVDAGDEATDGVSGRRQTNDG